MKQAEAEIAQERAKARLLDEQDRTDLLKARYDVERAKLDVSQQEILSPIDGAEKKLALADAEQKLHEEEAKQKSDQAGSQSLINAKVQERAKALADVQRAERRYCHHDPARHRQRRGDAACTISAPAVSTGNSAPEFRQGDLAWHMAPIAELPDFSTLQVNTRIDEVDRGRIQAGQSATVRFDAVPDREFQAHITQISALAKVDFSTLAAPAQFRCDAASGHQGRPAASRHERQWARSGQSLSPRQS